LRDPWKARDEYIQVIRDRSPANVMSSPAINPTNLQHLNRLTPLRLLEMQRHALMYTAVVGFEELKTGRNAFRYAARALNWLGMLQCSWKGFQTPCPSSSNVEFQTRFRIYRQLVLTAQINFRQQQYAITSLFGNHLSEVRSQNIEGEFILPASSS